MFFITYLYSSIDYSIFFGIGSIASHDKLPWQYFCDCKQSVNPQSKKEKFLGSVIKQVLLAHSFKVILA